MKKRYKEILAGIIAVLMVLSLIFNYAGEYYSSAQKTSSDYIIFAVSFYTASHLFCDKNYTCAYSNLTFPEFQKQELQKYQDQIDWTSEKGNYWKGISSQLIWISLILNFILLWTIWKSKESKS